MAEQQGQGGRGGRAATWPQRLRGVALPWPPGWAELFGRLSAHAAPLREWCAAEVAPGRLAPWMPVAFGLGIAIYFTAQREPVWQAAVALAVMLAAGAIVSRRHAVAFPAMLGLASAAAGFACASMRTAAIAHPILAQSAFGVSVSGFVEAREERERSDRIVVRVHEMSALRSGGPLERVRVSVRKNTAPAVGAFVSFKARLNPPLQPLRPGGYDFARDIYFHRVGAIGTAMGTITVGPPPVAPGLALRFASGVEGIRDAIDQRIRANVKGDAGAIASALITGKRDAISAPVNDAMYVSSLAHVLSISGYHMAVVAGVVFFVLRAGMALVPGLALRRPIKKWAAFGALVAAAAYLILSGNEVATQRSFLMTAIVLIGVMADRPALTLRTLAVAGFAVMLAAPEAVVHPSFQMSFAATLALIAAYERGIPWANAGADTSLGARVALWGGREIAALILASLVAGFATTPYAAFHFHRLAPYGVIANLFAMPVVSVLVMPAGLLALIAMPFGFDGVMWRLMEVGIDWMVLVALWVASLPGAVGRVPGFGVGALLVGTAGLFLICLLRTPLRWSGAALVAAAAALAAMTPRPDVLVAPGGEAFAVRTPEGRLAIVKSAGNPFAIREWLAADADLRLPTDIAQTLGRASAPPAAGPGFQCDPDGCVAHLKGGELVAVANSAAALVEDCRRVTLILTARDPLPQCAARVVSRQDWRDGGALSFTRNGDNWQVTAARPAGTDRPWSPARPTRPVRADSATAASPGAIRPQSRDATPRPEDLEIDDGVVGREPTDE